MDRLFILFQYFSPHQLLSRFTGWLAERSRPVWFKNALIRLFAGQFRVDMSEASEPDLTGYANFNDFFTRPLREGVRPLAEADIVCPADGAISQMGNITQGKLLQAKGRYFSLESLLGGDVERAGQYADGRFATIYLSPRDYHRVHMPQSARLTGTTYIPGKLFSVNGVTAEHVDNLFARNERLVCFFETQSGPMAMVLVGAMIVAGIRTVWSGQVAPPPRTQQRIDFTAAPAEVSLDKGVEMGRFLLGSTVILLYPPGVMHWDSQYAAGSPTRVGEALGHLT